jgi:hypothetical protein
VPCSLQYIEIFHKVSPNAKNLKESYEYIHNPKESITTIPVKLMLKHMMEIS